MTPSLARALLLTQLLLLLLGTQMPGALRAGIEAGLHAPFGVSSLGHFVLFTGMAWLASARPLSWPWSHVLLAALALACATEALQFVAIDRHPEWMDIGIDMAGALAGLLLGAVIHEHSV